jgi:DNA polymerase delta subunit 1
MCDFKVDDLAEAFRLGEEAARRITSEFRHPIELEFEKIQSPFLLYSKKRYASLKFTDPNEPGKVDAKGISLVRRDSCALVRDVTKQALDLILIHRDPKAACAVIHEAAKRLLAGQVPLDELVMSKALRGTYKAGILQPHDVVRGKIAARSPGEEPRAGDRVPFVYCETADGPKQSVTCRAEDPQHVEATGMLVDYFHYYHLLKSALDDTIDALKPELNAAFTGTGESEYKAKRAQRELHYSNARIGQREITSFFAAAAAATKQQPCEQQQDPFVEDDAT